MKKIGIIGAMEIEVAALKSRMTAVKLIQQAGRTFYEGQLENKDVIVVQCGVGKVNAALCAQILIDLFQVEAIINTGIAGSLDNKINIGDIVISTDTIQHDMEVVAFDHPRGQVPGLPVLAFEADHKLRELALFVCRQYLPEQNAFEGRILTGDVFLADAVRKDFLVSEFGGLCVEMEGAAIGHVAYLNQVPFLIVRSISDKADGSAHEDYPTFEQKAADNAVNIMIHLLTYLV